MPYIDVDLLSWGALAIVPSKLAKTAFFNSFGFELGFKKKVRELGKRACKASEAQNRQDWEDRCLREYLSGLREPYENVVIVSQLRHAKKKVTRIEAEIEQAHTNRESLAVIAGLKEQRAKFVENVEELIKAVAKHFREDLRLPTEMVIQQYIRDVFNTLGGINSKREAVPGLKHLPKDVRDGRRGLNWLTFVRALNRPRFLTVEPSIAQPKETPSNYLADGSTKTFSDVYSHDWKGKMNGLFRINDKVNRHGWEDKPYRRKIKHLYAVIEQTLIPDIAKIWESELGEAACRYIWAAPAFDSSNFSVLEKASKNHNEARQTSIKQKSIACRTKIIVPRIRTGGDIKFSETATDTVTLLHQLVALIPQVTPVIPNSGLRDEDIVRLIGHVRLGIDERERVSMMRRLKKLLTEPHRCMSLVKAGPNEDLPIADLWGDLRTHDETKDGSSLSFYRTSHIPMLPVFDDLMSLKCLDGFYEVVEQAISKDKEEREEQEESESGSESESV